MPSVPGPPLGVSRLYTREARSHAMEVDPGMSIVFYTDGLIEGTRDAIAGERRLVAALGGIRDVDQLAETIHGAMFGTTVVRDDVAILTLARDPGQDGSGTR